MKTLSILLLALLPQAVAGDPCGCGGCRGGHLAAIGPCVACRKDIPSCTDKLCRDCAASKGACVHCGKEIRTAQAFVGTAAAVDKQPRADLEYFVCTTEEGKPQGIYRSRRTPHAYAVGVRAIFGTAAGPDGVVLLRVLLPLAPKEKDLDVMGESEKPVRWRIHGVAGPEVSPKDGKYRLLLPAAPGATVDVVCGDQVLSRHVFENGNWMPAKQK